MGRGTSNSNVRGNTKARAARKRWLLKTYAADQKTKSYVLIGSGYSDWNVYKEGPPEDACRCYRCGDLLTFDTLTVDRIIPGCQGGRYVRNNIRPACETCNSKTGGALSGTSKKITR